MGKSFAGYIGLIGCCIGILLLSQVCFGNPHSCLLYYGNTPLPDDILYAFDWIILDPDSPCIKVINEKFYLKHKPKLFGYLSVGEIEKYRSYFHKIKKFSMGRNPVWDSLIADIRNSQYTNFLLDYVAKNIIDKGFDGFFLDTLDSYQIAAKKSQWPDFQKALVNFVKKLKQRYPTKLIIINRGFEIFDKVYPYIDGVLIEGLFQGLDNHKNYVAVSPKERKWLLSRLNKIKQKGIPIIVVDYVPPQKKSLAQKVAQKIVSLGFIPYIADKELSTIGLTNIHLIPRKIVLLYDSSLDSQKIPQIADIHRLVQMPLEYLGFIPELYDVNKPLPEISPHAGYIGIICSEINQKTKHLYKWLLKAKERGIKLFFINDFPFPLKAQYLKPFGLKAVSNLSGFKEPFQIVYQEKGAGFEMPLKISYTDTFIIPTTGTAVVKVKNSKGQVFVPFAITPWGGYALYNSLLNTRIEYWVYDPFKIFTKIFKKETFPIPDITTENGRRILTAHIDGDAFFGDCEFNPAQTVGETIRDYILKVYKIPHTVSIIEGETAPWGLYPNKSKRLENIAKSIFSLPNVEMASHTFSHPFNWQKIISETTHEDEAIHNLPIKNYTFSPEREIMGSINYLNSRLAPNPHKKTKVLLWSGDCSPNKREIRLAYIAKIFNVNGGDTTITYQNPFLANIAPSGVNYGPYFQVYAPIQNENIYTHGWRGPFWGYRNVIQTLELTESPRRLKPMSIYYHFYSGQKVASLKALQTVYKYALSKPNNPMFLSEYAARVLDFRNTAILRVKGGFKIRNSGYLRTLRVNPSWGYPDIARSKGVIGYKKEKGWLYIHLDGSGNYYLCFTQKEPQFRLISANGQVESFYANGKTYKLALKSYLPLEVNIEAKNCQLFLQGIIKKSQKGSFYYLQGEKHVLIKAICR